jgi:hypothetical protein
LGWEDQVRRLDFYHYNLIALYEFACKHNFEIDDSFMNVLSDVEEIWQNSEDAIPHSEFGTYGVQLKNASDETVEWWQSNKAGSISKDLLLAKSMGFLYQEKPQNLVEKIAASQENSFWMKNNQEFFQLAKSFLEKYVCY